MKSTYINIAVALAAVAMTACGDKKDNEPDPGPGPTPEGSVEVTIATSDIQTKAATLNFESGATMSIFAKTRSELESPNIVEGVKATYDGTKWTMSPKVLINQTQKNAFISAVAPYDASFTDPTKIPVDVTKQYDLMYSGAAQPASLTTSAVKLKMNHALSLLTFNIVPVSGNASQLKSIKVGGKNFYKTGTMNVKDGKITTGESGEVKVDFNKALEKGGFKRDLPGVWAIPFNTKAGAVDVEFVIDGKTYSLVMPEVDMKQGYQYIFRLALTANGLEFDPSKTETISLNILEEEKEPTFEGYGCMKITADGAAIYTPEFTGDAVFGTVASTSFNTPYSEGKKLNVQSGETVTVEAWNSTGFTISSLEGVKQIDLTDYE